MNNLVVILRGISGAGKSTYTRNNFPTAIVASADHFFGVGSDYKFDPSKLGAAHDSSFRTFKTALDSSVPVVVVDNTNTKLFEFKRYLDLATERGYEIKVIRLTIDPAIAAKRNVHGVPAEKVQQMQTRFQDYPGETVIDNNPTTGETAWQSPFPEPTKSAPTPTI